MTNFKTYNHVRMFNDAIQIQYYTIPPSSICFPQTTITKKSKDPKVSH